MNRRPVTRRSFLLGVLAVTALVAVPIGTIAAIKNHSHKSSLRGNSGKTLPRGIRESLGKNPTGGEPGEIDWTQPFVDTDRVSDLAAAAKDAGFAPVAASETLGPPAAVAVHRLYRPQAIGLVFDTPAFGRFLVLEDRARPNEQEFLENLAATCRPENGCEGSWTMILLKNGKRALLIANRDISNGVLWVQHGLSFDAFGPSATFSVADAEEVANTLAAAEAP